MPKFQWYQDKRQLFVTFLIKNLENQTVSQDDSWLNFSAVGDVQRVVQSHHFKQESQQQLSKKAVYAVQLPFKYKVVANRTKQQVVQGFKTFIFRKAAKGKEWKHLLKEPANSAYVKQMKKDWKKYGSESDDPEFLVEKAKNLDEAIAKGGITVIQFAPTWSERATEWAKQYGGAADALEDEARLVKVNALTDTAILERYGIEMSQRDDSPQPQYVVLVDGEQLDPGYTGETDTGKLTEFVRRLAKPPVVELSTRLDVAELLKSHPRCAVAWGVAPGSPALAAIVSASRKLQSVGEPGVRWAAVADTADSEDGSAAAFLRGSATVPRGAGAAVLLLAAEPTDKLPTAEQTVEGVRVTASRLLGDVEQLGAPELASSAAAWGYQAKGLEDQISSTAAAMQAKVDGAAQLGVATLFLHVKEAQGKNESALCASCPAAVAAVRAALAETGGPLLQVRGVASSGGHIRASVAQELATSHGLDGATFPALSLVRGPPGAAEAYAYSTAERGAITTGTVALFARAALGGELAPAVRSETLPLSPKGPGSGAVDKVVGLNAQEYVEREGVDAVLVVQREGGKYKDKAQKLADKMAHVPSLSFGALDLAKNGVPPALAERLGEAKAWEGLWMFPAEGKPVRAKRKAALKELAKWIKGSAAVPFEAKASGLPPGTYADSCKGCRVEEPQGTRTLVCASCTGGMKDAGKVSMELEACPSGFINDVGKLACDKAAEMAAEVAAEVGDEGGEAKEEGEEAAADKKEL